MKPAATHHVQKDVHASHSITNSTTDVERNYSTNKNKHIKRERTSDANIVGWDGEDDPECPLNWSSKNKWTSAGLLSAMTFITQAPISDCSFQHSHGHLNRLLASSMFPHGVEEALDEFHSTVGIQIVQCGRNITKRVKF
jgi:hypothetical protein